MLRGLALAGVAGPAGVGGGGPEAGAAGVAVASVAAPATALSSASPAVGGLEVGLGPQWGSAPGAPVGAALAWTVAAAARREFGQPSAAAVTASQVANQPPVIAGVPLSAPNTATGALTGTVRASDPDGDGLTYRATTTAKGVVTITAAGVFTYTPTAAARHAAAKSGAAAAVKSDTVTVTVTDARGAVTTQAVSVPISPANSVPTGAKATVGAPNASTGVVTGTVSATDADRDGLSFAAPASTSKGAIVINATTGAFTYTPTAAARANAAKAGAPAADKADSFTVTITDGYGGTATAAVAVTIAPAVAPAGNAAPRAGTPTMTVSATTGVVAGAVNAIDPDNDTLTYAAAGDPSKGTVTITPLGIFIYTPTLEARHAAAKDDASPAAMTDSFTVTVSDSRGLSSRVPVTVNISPANNAPNGGVASRSFADPGNGMVSGFIALSDVDGDDVYYSYFRVSSKGSVTVNPDGSFIFTPTAAAWAAASSPNATQGEKTDTFVVTLTDDYGGSTPVPVTVVLDQAPAVSATNRSPVAGVPSAISSATTGVTTGAVNAVDPDNDTLTYISAGGASKGNVTVTREGLYVYTPTSQARHAAAKTNASAADKTDTFTVTVSDSRGRTAIIPVSVTISPANTDPIAAIGFRGLADVTTGVLKGLLIAGDVEDDAVYFSYPQTTGKGSVTLDRDGNFTYTPSAAARDAAARTNAIQADKTDTFTVTYTDDYGGISKLPVTVTVSPAPGGAANRPPVSGTPTFTTNSTTGVVSGAVNAADPDGDRLTYSVATTTSKGTVSVTAAGAFTYTPTATARHEAAKLGAAASVKTDSFTVSVSDGKGGTLSIPVQVTISPQNSAPTGARALLDSTNASTGVAIGTISATDLDKDVLTFSGPPSTSKGAISINASTGAFTYSPAPSARGIAAGVDTFTVTVSDGYGGVTSVEVSVPIPAWVSTNSMIRYVFNFTSGAEFWSADAIKALQFAGDKIASYIAVNQPVTLTFDVTGVSSPDTSTLASAVSNLAGFGSGYFYTVVQNKILNGNDFNDAAADGSIEVNFAKPFALGDTVGAGQYDLVSVLMHEFMHAYGFTSALVEPGNNTRTSWPLFTSGIFGGNGVKLIDSDSYRLNSALDANLTGGNRGLYFAGNNAVDAYGGLVPLFTPEVWDTGSSGSHLDDYTFFGNNIKLMNAKVGSGPGVRELSAVEQGILKDIGYAVQNPLWASVLFAVFLFTRRRSAGQARSPLSA